MEQFSLPDVYKDLDTIIFDLGGVLLNLDYTRTSAAFDAFSDSGFDALYSQAEQQDLFDDFEIGAISPDGFRKGIRELLNKELLDAQIDTAWNAMLLDMPEDRVALLEKLSHQKQLLLLSNTNEIHVRSFEAGMREGVGLERFKSVFDSCYYSSRIGMRKPHSETFTWVLEQHGLESDKTLFIDDSVQHVHGARAAGLHAIHLEDEVLDLFAFLRDGLA